MKPKIREKGLTSSDIILRGNEHCDVVYPNADGVGVFHNMIAISDANKKVHYLWKRYPHLRLFGRGSFASSGTGSRYYLTIDVDRQFVHSLSLGSSTTTCDILDGNVAYSSAYNDTRFYFSKDASVFAEATPTSLPSNLYAYQKWKKKNQICKVNKVTDEELGYTLQTDVYTLDFDNNTIEVVSNNPIPIPNNYINSLYYLAKTKDGCLMYTTSSTASTIKKDIVIEVTDTEIRELYVMDETYLYTGSDAWRRAVYANGYYVFVVGSNTRASSSKPTTHHHYISYCHESDMTNWNTIDLEPVENSNFNSGKDVMQVVYRNGWFYIYTCLTHSSTRSQLIGWKTQNFQTFENLNIPQYTDVAMSARGDMVKTVEYDTVRVIWDNDAPVEEGQTKVNGYTMGNRWHDCYFNLCQKEGVLEEEPSLDYVVMSVGSHIIYFDNMELTQSDDNFAFAYTNGADATKGAEIVSEGDYCYTPPEETESEEGA